MSATVTERKPLVAAKKQAESVQKGGAMQEEKALPTRKWRIFSPESQAELAAYQASMGNPEPLTEDEVVAICHEGREMNYDKPVKQGSAE